jgi:DNA-binding FrmR family transcriptional regulator
MQADKKQITRLLNTARGQIDGILKMIEDDRYCLDISHQLLATQAVLRRANKEIIASHMKHCVMGVENEEELNQKVEELTKLIDDLIK